MTKISSESMALKPMPILRASVTIATWNRRSLLERILEALVTQTIETSEFEVIVCDSGSTDGTKDLVHGFAARYVNIRYVDVDVNSLATKRNEGIRRAKSDIVIFMDDDAIPEAHFVEVHVKAHETTDGAVYCGQIRYPETWIKQSNYFRFRDSRHLGSTRPDIQRDNVPPWMITVMNLSFKRSEVIERIGYVSEEFKRYGGEDVEFGFRIVAAGLKLVYLSQALVVHYEYEGSIAKYFRKLYISARDSAPILLRLAPEFQEATRARYLEHIYSEPGKQFAFLRMMGRICTSRYAVRFLTRMLEKTDSVRFLYQPVAFFYFASVATISGIRDRSHSSERIGWFD